MNLTINERFLLGYGSTWIIDSFYLFIICPVSLIGFLLNVLSLYIISIINIKNSILNTYLKIYCVNSSFVCFLAITSFYAYSPRYIGLHFNYFARVYKVINNFN